MSRTDSNGHLPVYMKHPNRALHNECNTYMLHMQVAACTSNTVIFFFFENIQVNLTGPVSMPVWKTISPFTVSVHPRVPLLHFNSKITLYTNASEFHIPIYVYNGRLKVVHHRPEIFKGQLDFGTLGVEEKRSMTFTLRNENPVNVSCT